MPIVATTLLLFTLGQTPADDPPVHEPARATTECPTLFGSRAQHDRNARWRGNAFHGVRRTERTLDVVHSIASWREPVRIRLPGLEVVSIERDADGKAHARVRVGDDLGACPGDFALSVDDSIGADANVLAVVDEGVLVMHDGDLVMLAAPGKADPDFRMIWQSGFVVDVSSTAKGGKAGKNTKAAARKGGTSKKEASRAARKARRATPKKPKG